MAERIPRRCARRGAPLVRECVRERGLIHGQATAWLLLSAVLAFLALAGSGMAAERWNWQPGLVVTEPWRWWTPVLIHLSALHLAANVAGVVMVAWVGWAAGATARVALAWLLAWPLTHLGLLLRPELDRYAGLSGVLHAGVACLALHLLLRGFGRAWGDPVRRRQAQIGAAILLVLAVKVALEAPWGPAARPVAGWDILVAPIGHATGVLAGLVCMVLVDGLAGMRARRS